MIPRMAGTAGFEQYDTEEQQYLEPFHRAPAVLSKHSSLSRRAVLGALCGTFLPGGVFAAPSRQRVVSLDYALAETLIALKHPPIGLANVPGWKEWVVEPPLPPETLDVGLDLDPNLELLAALKPDLILTTDYVARSEESLRRIAPVERLTVYAEGRPPLLQSAEVLMRLGQRLGAEAQATAYLEETEAVLEDLRERASRLAVPPLLLVSFMDSRHVRVYGSPGLYQNVLDRIGLRNAWTKTTNLWGFATVGIESLAELPQARLVTFDPLPPDVPAMLAESPLWTSLPFVRRGAIRKLPPVLMFGALPSARRFGELLVFDIEAHSG